MTTSGRSGPVVAGVDYSGTSAAALAYAAWEAQRRDVGLVLVNGFVPTQSKDDATQLSAVDNDLLIAARERLAEVASNVRREHPDLPISTKVLTGSGGLTLVSESTSASLVVVGSRGSGGFDG